MHLLLTPTASGACISDIDSEGHITGQTEAAEDDLPGIVARREQDRPRWVWADTGQWYPRLLRAGIRVERCVDLRLCRAILRRSTAVSESALALGPASPWDTAFAADPDESLTLFDLADSESDFDASEAHTELQRQWQAVAGAADPGRVRLLLAAESAGALIAEELKHHGMPFDTAIHDARLTEMLGPRPPRGYRPAKLEALAESIRVELNAPQLNPDSHASLLAALRHAELDVASTRQWEIEQLDHPAIAPLLEFKKLSRLLSANGWAWMDEWVADGRFRADYVPGGVVTGRWATRGGGALQLPKQIRAAVKADPGWKLVVADAAQLEPRALAAMSQDQAMAGAAQGRDLYQGLVDAGVVNTRDKAKVAMLGALYGATTGESGQLMPRLRRAYPRAIQFVEAAAQTGEAGGIVSTWLGRSSPPPGEAWHDLQREASSGESSPALVQRARAQSRDWGRFTRNFVVQGTAAEWALCWMASLRQRLSTLAKHANAGLSQHPHLAFFLHDEVMVHCPESLSGHVADAVRLAAEDAGQLLFGSFPVEFAVQVAIVDDYAEAK